MPPVLWTGAFLPCVYGIIKVGRNAAAFLGNAADKRRMRTALGSVHGTIKVGRNASETLSGGVPAYCTVTGNCLGRNKSHKVPGQESFGLLLDIWQRC